METGGFTSFSSCSLTVSILIQIQYCVSRDPTSEQKLTGKQEMRNQLSISVLKQENSR